MADNTQLNTGTGGDTIRDKDRSGVKTQIVGLDLNPAGSEVLGTGDATNGLDVDVTRVQGTVTVSGTVTANLAAGANNVGKVDVNAAPAQAADNGALPAVVDVVGGYDGTNVQVLKTDVNGILQTAQNGTVTVTGTVTANAGTGTLATNVAQMAGTATDVNSGNKSAGTQRVVLATDQPQLTNALKVDGSAVTQPVSDGSGSLTVDAPVGTPVFVRLSDGTAAITTLAVSLATAPALVAGTATIGNVGLAPRSSGGCSVIKNLDIDETEDAIKASAGQFYGYHLFNAAASTVYVKLYNDTVANVVVGTTVPVMTIPIPAGSAANVEFTNGIAFSAAITVAATTGVADNDTGAPATNQVVGNFTYV